MINIQELYNSYSHRNIRISEIRSAMEHPCAFYMGIFHFFHVIVKMVQMVGVKTCYTAMCCNPVSA
ncbi:MAG: hypothetical protein M1605_04445 [Candidatus Thermoplasmatota archaeon]|nr:hypothetical protein [Candidatus Thermoplasmatota archaeon]